jgi:F0F1-type ATP synthase delta subunit
MFIDKQIRNLAKKLLEFSIVDGEVSSEKVREVLNALSANPPRKLKTILFVYKKYISREISKYTATLEHAGPISEQAKQSVKVFLEKDTNRNIHIQTVDNPDLLAGIRVSIGDDVYEDSAAFRLKPLAETTL